MVSAFALAAQSVQLASATIIGTVSFIYPLGDSRAHQSSIATTIRPRLNLVPRRSFQIRTVASQSIVWTDAGTIPATVVTSIDVIVAVIVIVVIVIGIAAVNDERIGVIAMAIIMRTEAISPSAIISMPAAIEVPAAIEAMKTAKASVISNQLG
jgi:hypothetical protein